MAVGSSGCISVPVGEGWDSGLWQVGSPCKSPISSPWETSQAKRTVYKVVESDDVGH